MLKFTEAELAEMGFSLWTAARGKVYHYGFPTTIAIGVVSGRVYVTSPEDTDVIEAYPQTKEDLLTLIRLFTPPKDAQ